MSESAQISGKIYLKEMPAGYNISGEDWNRLQNLVESRLGIRLGKEKIHLLQNRVSRRMRTLNLQTSGEYCNYLFSQEGQASELHEFCDEMTTNKTFFFREFRHFEFLNDHILPVITKSYLGKGRPVRIWSSACSTGEEVYSIACIIEEYFREEKIRVPYEILGTDVSTKVLRTAYQAIYEENQVRMIDASLANRYFMRSRDEKTPYLRVNPEIRSRIKFKKLNLIHEKYNIEKDFDIIFCRNVLIYFSRPDITRVSLQLASHLRKGGYLIVGHADALGGELQNLKSIEPSIFRKL